MPHVSELFLDYETRMKAYNIHWEIFSATNFIVIQEKKKLLTETRLDGNHKSQKSFDISKKESESENNLMIFPHFARAPREVEPSITGMRK